MLKTTYCFTAGKVDSEIYFSYLEYGWLLKSVHYWLGYFYKITGNFMNIYEHTAVIKYRS